MGAINPTQNIMGLSRPNEMSTQKSYLQCRYEVTSLYNKLADETNPKSFW